MKDSRLCERNSATLPQPQACGNQFCSHWPEGFQMGASVATTPLSSNTQGQPRAALATLEGGRGYGEMGSGESAFIPAKWEEGPGW